MSVPPVGAVVTRTRALAPVLWAIALCAAVVALLGAGVRTGVDAQLDLDTAVSQALYAGDDRSTALDGLLEVLTASGLAGLAGFLALMIGSVLVLWRIPPEYGMLAVLVVIGRFVQGQLDIFWVAAQTSIPFVIAGICLGLHARDEDTAHTREEMRATIPDAPVPTTRV